MTAVADTNSVLAFLLPDRSVEREILADWIDEHGPLLITEGVFAEVCWILGKDLAPARASLTDHLRGLLSSSSFGVWDDDLASAALGLMERYPRLAIVDCLLAARAARGDTVVTFDRRLSQAIEQL